MTPDTRTWHTSATNRPATPWLETPGRRGICPYLDGDQKQPFIIAFLVEEWSGTPVGDDDETLELGFFAFDDLPPEDAIHPPHRKALRDVRAFLANGILIVD